jgi:glycerol kinase
VLGELGVSPAERDELEAAAFEIERAGRAPTGHDPAASRAGLAYHAALDEQGAAAAEVLAHMSAVAGPAQRLVVTGGWAVGAGARAVKQRHLGPFEHSPALSTGARGAALIAGRAAGLWSLDDARHGVGVT